MNPTFPSGFGAIIIGDEILSGKRRDGHMAKIIELLDQRGLELNWACFLGDEPQRLTDTLRGTMAGNDVVFSFGGIGGTPDDRTRQCAAAAAGLELETHPEGLRLIREQFGDDIKPERLRMIEFPKGASLVPNPVNRVPGFSLGHHYFVPGFPNMAWPMIEWVLDHHYGHLHAVGSRKERALVVHGVRESQAIPLLEEFTAEYPQVRVSCLPRWCPPDYELELGVRGPNDAVDTVIEALQRRLDEQGDRWEERTPGA
ncbi:molybdopterin-binding protein [Aquisalimonas lutea]|uniref:competence/damage-inducible protein A n=1 Tax=Aquisalimonas lutea TaxID=1327750 RepID=UPI0025B4BA85|nr:molybdopterin-binding protein [Aquisalimonas lutea]MDN3518995.1 molybdopterin-binding protein [Aquisalimonas lutea]